MTVDHNSDDSDLRDDKRLYKEEKYRNAGVHENSKSQNFDLIEI